LPETKKRATVTSMWRVFFAILLIATGKLAAAAPWVAIDTTALVDDDLQRHSGDKLYLDGLSVSETRFSESGFDWHLLRFANSAKLLGPLWAVPHDDENAAFEAAIAAVKQYGGVLVVVNSGPGSSRLQWGQGTCGGRRAVLNKCDPNRNFSASTPLYTRAFLDELRAGQPIIALHTNSPGYGRGQGDITILDVKAAGKGKMRSRKDGHFGRNQLSSLADPDSYAIIPYLPTKPNDADVSCRNGLVEEGINVWHERVEKSDGSLSNFVALQMPAVRYVNMESRREIDLAIAAERHRLMVAAYIKSCTRSGN
jgi:hypothetical protein